MIQLKAQVFRLVEPFTTERGTLLRAGTMLRPENAGHIVKFTCRGVDMPPHIVAAHDVLVVDFKVDSDGEIDAIIVDRHGVISRVRAEYLRVEDVSSLGVHRVVKEESSG